MRFKINIGVQVGQNSVVRQDTHTHIYVCVYIYIYTYTHTHTHVSTFILVINQLDAQNFTISLFHASTCFEHHVLIIRKSKLYFTASGIITLKQVNGLKLLK